MFFKDKNVTKLLTV